MPFDRHIDEEANLLVARLSGEIDAGTLLSEIEAAKHDGRLQPGYRTYIDLTDAVPAGIDGETVRRAAQIACQFDAKEGPVRVAILAKSDVAYGLARMYATLSEQLQRHVAVFRDPAPARRWLGITDPEGDLAA